MTANLYLPKAAEGPSPTDLWSYVVDGYVERNCDCIYHVSTYRWNYSMAAALVVPRPLMISKDWSYPVAVDEALGWEKGRVSVSVQKDCPPSQLDGGLSKKRWLVQEPDPVKVP